MNLDFKRLMQDATRLVRDGNLQGATAAIRQALGGGRSSGAGKRAPDGDIVVDVQAKERTDGRALPQAGRGGAAPAPGSFTSGRAGDGRGERAYKLFVPPQAGAQPLPLVVMLHGCTQDPDDFANGTRMNEAARAQGFYVLYPAQSRQANPQRCWNWFKHTHQQRGRGEPALLAAMVRQVMARHPIDPARVYVAGLSAGGAMAAILGESYPDLFAAVGVHSGLAAGAARDLPSAMAAMRSGAASARPAAHRVPTIVFHGDADATVHPDNGRHVVAAVAGDVAGEEHAQERSSDGRGYTRRVHPGRDGSASAEHWVVHGAGHAWSGGSVRGSYTDPAGPDATAEMLRFFLAHPRAADDPAG